MGSFSGSSGDLESRYRAVKNGYLLRGIAAAVIGGMLFGLYSAIASLATSRGIWAIWYDGGSALIAGAFATTYVLGSLTACMNDTIAAAWCLAICASRGKFADIFRTLRSRPGAIVCLCGVVGGPIGTTAYLTALHVAGSVVIPVVALEAAIGTLLGHVLYRQELNARIIAGVIICFGASVLVSSNGLSGFSDKTLMGCLIALVTAFSYAFEGCVAGYYTSVMDSEIAFTLRECTSALVNVCIVLPTLCAMAGDVAIAPKVLAGAWSDGSSLPFFILSGLATAVSYIMWYKGVGMCGAALGMASNGTYSFWGPLLCWLILGVGLGQPGWAFYPAQWAAALIMVFGISVIALDPKEFFGRSRTREDSADRELAPPDASAGEGVDAASDGGKTSPPPDTTGRGRTENLPLSYAILRYAAKAGETCPADVVAVLRPRFGNRRALKEGYAREVLMTAEKNGLLEETRHTVDDAGKIVICYRATDSGRKLIGRYVG